MAKESKKIVAPAGRHEYKKGEYRGKHVVLRPYVSEKSQRLLADNQYSFLVSPDASKVSVREEIERTYGVHVTGVEVTKVRIKTKHYRGKSTSFKPKKKATVRLRAGEKIDIA